MSHKRNRTTWGQADRNASAAPATPGYGSEDQGHPAHQTDPAHEKYKKGDPSAWAEDVHKPPYPEGNPPAVPGYDSEDQDHPAHRKNPRVPKEGNLKAQIQRKAAKCLVLAKHMLGKSASQANVESQALDMMDHSDNYIEASLKRIGGGFLAMDDDMFLGMGEDDMGMDDEMFGMDDGMDMMDDDGMYGMEDDFMEDAPGGDMMSMMASLRSEIRSLKAQVAGQNAPNSKGKPEEGLRSDADATDSGEVKSAGSARFASLQGRLASYFTANGGGADGFAMVSDWKGSKALFAALDTDNDGIIASDDMVQVLFNPSDAMLTAAEDFAGAEVQMLTACGEMVLAGEVPEAFKKQWKDKGDSKDKKDDDKDSGKPWEKDKKKAGGDEDGDEDDDGEGDDLFAGKKKAGGDEDEDDKGDDESDKDASSLFDTSGFDPMGISQGQSLKLSDQDEALLSEIFSTGGSAQAPQPRQASNGVTSLGNQTRTASKKGSIDELSKIWKSAPDVKHHFGVV